MSSPSSCFCVSVVLGWALGACKPPASPALVDPEPVVLDPRQSEQPQPAATAPVEPDLYGEAREVLEARCVVCHGCYDAPCQLKLDEPGGVFRGASKQPVYDGARLKAVTPTRYGIDAQSVEGWRELGFYPVVQTDATGAALPESPLRRLLALKREHPLPAGKLLPESIPVGFDREAECAEADEMDDYVESHPTWGMPYGLPGISEAEQSSLEAWLLDGAPVPDLPLLAAETAAVVARWETFLNQPDLKAQLMSRYLYEHLFLATLQIEGGDDEPVPFRLVRSVTPPGEPIVEMATRRPFDPPVGHALYYRLRRRTATQLSKTHMPYVLDPARMALWRELFLEPDYEVKELPGYEAEQAANPFATFSDIPIRSRYAFLLSEAEFTLMGFIKGPVCRGQVALDVIQDQFWVTFVEPDAPLIQAEDDFLRKNAGHLALPAGDGSNALLSNWFRYSRKQRKYLEAKSDFLIQQAQEARPSLAFIWDGDGENPNAGLTVFRHYDSASVSKGLLGPKPKTAWVLGYGVLERIHYLLVAGFDVFGNVGHQLNTRLYMDFLRMEAEHNFLLLLPKRVRRPLVDAWYQDVGKRVKEEVYGEVASFPVETGIDYQSDHPKGELLDALQIHLKDALSSQRPSLAQLDDPGLREPLELLASTAGRGASQFPEEAFLTVRGGPRGDAHFTLLRTSAHTNVAHLFREDDRRVPEADDLVVLPGFLGAYPNALFVVDREELPQLAERAVAIDGEEAYEAFVDAYGVRRTDPRFWKHSDALLEARRSIDGPEAGLLDYNRLENR